MCATCGCTPHAAPAAHDPHAHDHGPGHDHDHGPTVRIEADILSKNDGLAARNRAWLRDRSIVALNLVSSPGSGKTTLLARSIQDLKGRLAISVIEGDQATSRDADRIRAAGAEAVQINTGSACHLDAHQVAHALGDLRPSPGTCVVVENVGNLICPSLFDLGEDQRVLVSSVTEGEDKPVKYPHMFRSASLIVLNKIDLLPYVSFSVERFREFVREVNPRAQILALSATRGDGLSEWYEWLLSVAGRQVPV
jgi:hydrogenase nickel incorporation protein HypB